MEETVRREVTEAYLKELTGGAKVERFNIDGSPKGITAAPK